MIELPEAVTIAAQMTKELTGKRIATALRGNAPHKFAFYNREPDEFAGLMKGKIVGETITRGPMIHTLLGEDYYFVLGGGGERIFLHANEATLPKRHQFLIAFEDGMYLSVTVQMWGFMQLFDRDAVEIQEQERKQGLTPLSDRFTFEYFNGLFDGLEAKDPRAIKFFMISQPGVAGVGNGCLHDILYRAKLHPRRRAVELHLEEREALYAATRDTIRQMTALGGRDSELDLYGCPGRYQRILGSHSAEKPCPECGAPIQKIAFLGGASYFCPRCQI